MRTYRQYCPIARASEVLAERWTPIILRNVLNGSRTFTEIANGAPGLSRTLLSTRLRELEQVGVLTREPSPSGRGWTYVPTEAGRDLAGVIAALGSWGDRWTSLELQHADPGFVLHAWVSWYLAVERLPDRRIMVRFRFPRMPARARTFWVIFDGDRSEVCLKDPGFELDLLVEADPLALAQWHLGKIEWLEAVDDGRIRVDGPPRLARALPTWNRRSKAARTAKAGSAAR